jgi:hypothetical protein
MNNSVLVDATSGISVKNLTPISGFSTGGRANGFLRKLVDFFYPSIVSVKLPRTVTIKIGTEGAIKRQATNIRKQICKKRD